MSAKKKTSKKVTRVKAATSEPLPGERALFLAHQARKKERMLEALEKHMGTVKYAIREVGIARKTHYNWMRDDPEYAATVEDINEGVGDFVERKLLEAVQEKQPAVMIFLAKTKWKHRGYQERVEFTGADGGAIKLGGHLDIRQAQQEVPPEAIRQVMEKIMGGSGRAEEALAKLMKKHEHDK
jgi:hypothetical protein